MDLKLLTVYESQFKKIRLGKDYDGGYIICDIPDIKYDCILAGGIENDLSFEEDFCKKYRDTICLAYDGTINEICTEEKNIIFIKKNIGFEENNQVTNLHQEIEKYENIMIKMDIEGGEIPWMLSLDDKHLNKFVQIVMEFHHPFSPVEFEVFRKINRTHLLVHFHANNACGVRNIGPCIIPNVFECTYINKKYLKEPYLLNKEKLPTNIDMQNVLTHSDIYLDNPPFVN